MEITVKTDQDLAGMRRAGQLAAEVLEMVGPQVQPGVTTMELNRICHEYIVEVQQAIPAPLNYRGFPCSICTSPNHVICHGIPDNRRLRDGDILNIDVTVIKDGWHGDTSYMFLVGNVPDRSRQLVDTCYKSMHHAIELVRPGRLLDDIGIAIQDYVEARNYSVVREYCGHGIGKVFHMAPEVLHYRPEIPRGIVLHEGMTFTIEPMVNMGKRHVQLQQDGWTVVTRDRKPSAQWEHTVLVTADGCEVLTRRSDETFP
ncbi:MAG: type I methionyl aminopeptidase [Candidatus Porifericomitaceae bacterium WSBS_2022_MAG_OTU9]